MGYVEAVYRGPNKRETDRVEPRPKLRFLSETELRPFDLSIVTNLLGLYIPIPKSASIYDAKRDQLDPTKRNTAFLPRHRHSIKDGPLKNLIALLETIVDAQLKKVNLREIKSSLKAESIQEIFFHQGSLNRKEYVHFASLVGYWYGELHQEALIKRRHIQDHCYHHPKSHQGKNRLKEDTDLQLATFTEINVNSWAITDDEDPTIVYNSKGGASLLNSRHDVPFHQRKALAFPGNVPRAHQPGYDELLKAVDFMTRDTALEKKRYKEWVAFGEGQIGALEAIYLGGDVLEIPRSRHRIWRVVFRLGDDPKQVASTTLMNSNIRRVSYHQYAEIISGLAKRLLEEYSQTGSDYWKLQTWKADLKLRKLKREISKKLRKRWRFVLQHVPTKERAIKGSCCAHPTCYHRESIPAGSFRLNFMNPEQHTEEPAYFLNETMKDDPQTPGRAANGQMWFCLTCVENLFDGNGLIDRIGEEKVDGKVSSQSILWGGSQVNVKAAWQDRQEESIANTVAHTAARSLTLLTKTTGGKRKYVDQDNLISGNKAPKLRGDASPNKECTARKKKTALSEVSGLIPFGVASREGHRRLSPSEFIQAADEDNPMIMRDDDASTNAGFFNADDVIEALHMAEANFTNKESPSMRIADRTRTLDTQLSPAEYSVDTHNLDSPTPMITPSHEPDPAFRYPIPPRLFRTAHPPGLTTFTSLLSTFIDPEVRYTVSECYTLSPQEYFGLQIWKDLSTHLFLWQHPLNGKPAHLDETEFHGRNGTLTDIHGPNTIGSREIDGQKLTIEDCIVRAGGKTRDGVISSENHLKLKPLSEIMDLIDSRAAKATDVETEKHSRSIAEREWPFRSFWEKEFEVERRRLKAVKLSEKIIENDKLLFELHKDFQQTEKDGKERRRKQEKIVRFLEEEAELIATREKMTEEVNDVSIAEKIKMNEKIIERLMEDAEEEEM